MITLSKVLFLLCVLATTLQTSIIKNNFENNEYEIISKERLLQLKQNMSNHISKYNKEKADEITNYIFEASIKYDLNPVFVMSIIQLESYFKTTVTHKHKNVKGISGINYNLWKDILSENNINHIKTLKNQIEATAIIIKDFQRRYKTNDELKILHYYKGTGYDKYLNKSGLSLAKHNYKVYEKNLEKIYR